MKDVFGKQKYSYFPGSLDAFADAGEDDEPGEEKRETQIPLHLAHILDPVWDVQNLASEYMKNFPDVCSVKY